MRVTLESTDKIVELNGVPARVWEGTTAAGIRCHAFITRIAVRRSDDTKQFDDELKETHAPASADVKAYPLRLVI